MTDTLLEPVSFAHGPAMKNRFMLAPLTNCQSNADGTLTDEEYHWLVKRAEGGFGLTMTCAAHVQQNGQAFPGQLGIWDDRHLAGLERLASGIRKAGSLSSVQLHHGGLRADPEIVADRYCPWNDEASGARAMSTGEVEQFIEDTIVAGVRAEKAGFDGIEVHGAHHYLYCQFVDIHNNKREDKFGGSYENRTRVIKSVLGGLRERTGPDFQIGIRLSPERHGMILKEARQLCQEIMVSGDVDYVDMSLWKAFKDPVEEDFRERPLIKWFTDLERGNARLGCAGNIYSAAEARECVDAGMDFVLLGRGAILHHDFPEKVRADADFKMIERPVTAEYLMKEGLSPKFVEYMRNWPGFVAEPA